MIFDRIIYILSNWPLYGLEFILPYIVVFFAFKNYKFLKSPEKLLLAAFVFWLLLDLRIWYLAILKENNYLFQNLQELGFSTLVVLSFIKYFKLNILWYLSIFLVIQIVFYTLNDTGFEKYYLFSVNRLIFLVASIVFFYRTLEEMRVEKLTDFPWFWFFAAFLIYSASTVIMYLLSELTITVQTDSNENIFYKNFNLFFGFMLYILTAIGFNKARKYKLTYG